MSSSASSPISETPERLTHDVDFASSVHVTSDMDQSIGIPRRGRGRVRPGERRCFSCLEAAQKSRPYFSSPDRFLAPRVESTERHCIFRVSRPPQSLSPRERDARRGESTADPFRYTSTSRSRDAVDRLLRTPSGTHQPPHFTPSFIQGPDASLGPSDVVNSPDAPRQVSHGAVWNVGGPAIARGMPRPGIQDGHGRVLASGTNGPLHTAHFLDKKGSTQDLRQHEDRLALALEIDRASRVLALTSQPQLTQSPSLEPPQCRHFKWQDNLWSREQGAERELLRVFCDHIFHD
jgi:hypothetical protein